MAGELLSFALQKLLDLLSQEYERFQGVEDQVIGLKRDLNLLSSFLKDTDAKKHTTVVVRNVVEVIQEIVYDAEDMIETYLLKEELGKTSGIKKSIRRIACIIPKRRRHVLDIGSIRTRISNVVQDMQRFGVQQAIANDEYMQPNSDVKREIRQAFPKDYESDFVGLEINVKKLVRDLVEKDDIQIVSITGMGGLGKTTLARQVFNHEDVKHRFDGFAWVCVSQEFTRISVWQTILQNLSSKEKKDEILTMKEAELQDELFLLLETSKSLIVFDDIWKDEDWDRIKPMFPPKKGWKVLITSRNESVAVGGDTKYLNFKPECLTSEDTWTLFQRIAFPKKDVSCKNTMMGESTFNPWLFQDFLVAIKEFSDAFLLDKCKVDEEMKKMGAQMIKHCGGLPLAIKVLGGLLAAKYTLHDWKRLSENIGSHILGRTSGNNSFIYHVLSMSFEELPSYLKHCFLYLAHFPDDHKINVENLSYFWVAEGIFKPSYQDGETIRDVGESCIDELVRRNMVISERDSKRLRFKTCHLHDMMREICLFKAKEENFLEIAGSYSTPSNFQSPCRSRRLVCQHPTTLHVEKDINTQKLRSLMVVLDRYGKRLELLGTSYKRLELLRVLYLFKAKFGGGKLPSSIGKLIHLRYLSLKDAEVLHIPSSLGNLKLLIYLNMDVLMGLEFVPNVLMGMQELRYLELPPSNFNDSNLELSNLVILETLRNFSTKNSSLEDLHGMVRLRTLEITLTSEISIKTLYESISGLSNLENLEIKEYGPDRKLEEGIVLDFDNLRKLSLSIQMPRLPKAQHFPSQVMILSLSGCGLEEDPMPFLEKLLQLRKVSLWCQSFYGTRMVCSRDGFPQLQKLVLSELQELEEWIVEKGSMPLLHTLTIYRCPKLKQLPDGIKYITSLRNLTLGKTWEKSLWRRLLQSQTHSFC